MQHFVQTHENRWDGSQIIHRRRYICYERRIFKDPTVWNWIDSRNVVTDRSNRKVCNRRFGHKNCLSLPGMKPRFHCRSVPCLVITTTKFLRDRTLWYQVDPFNVVEDGSNREMCNRAVLDALNLRNITCPRCKWNHGSTIVQTAAPHMSHPDATTV